MSLPDDYRISIHQQKAIQSESKKILMKSGALGVFPTPIDAIVKYTEVKVVDENIYDESFIKKIYHKAGGLLKKAIETVQGLLDVAARLIYIDKSKLRVKQIFLTLHEIAHATLPWQNKIYKVIEDCETTLSSEVSDDFDKEANAFASEVLFQNDSFTKEAEKHDFGILVPVNLKNKYGSSIYAAIRRYVFCSNKICAVIVLNMPELVQGRGLVAKLRRSVNSPEFDKVFDIKWQEEFTSGDPIGACIPVGKRRMSGKHEIYLRDRNGDQQICVIEAFTQTYQIFILVHAIKTLTKTTIIFPKSGIEAFL
jgi:Zn-dependent peptidase ImmA (M78 family)